MDIKQEEIPLEKDPRLIKTAGLFTLLAKNARSATHGSIIETENEESTYLKIPPLHKAKDIHGSAIGFRGWDAEALKKSSTSIITGTSSSMDRNFNNNNNRYYHSSVSQ